MSSIDSRRLDQSFRLLRLGAAPRAWFVFLFMCLQQTDWLAGNGIGSVWFGLTLSFSFVDFGSGSHGQGRK